MTADARYSPPAAVAQTLLHERGRAARRSAGRPRPVRPRALGLRSAPDHARMRTARDGGCRSDQHVSPRIILAEQAGSQPSCAGDARGPQPRDGFQKEPSQVVGILGMKARL